ncbi:MAG: hypothetical protein MK212_15785 [Saprospiraceae bacterium]|nr:hypothetical protein [Saprospiraceae bacterium]
MSNKTLKELQAELNKAQSDKAVAEALVQKGDAAKKGLAEKRKAIAEKQKEIVKIGTNHERAVINVGKDILRTKGEGLKHLRISMSIHDAEGLKKDLQRRNAAMTQNVGTQGGSIIIKAEDLSDADLTKLQEAIDIIDFITTGRQKAVMSQVTKNQGKALSEFENADPFYTELED